MKTFDGIKLIQKHISQELSKYPEGSLSSREVLLTIPISSDPKQLVDKVNSIITYTIFKTAEEHIKSASKNQDLKHLCNSIVTNISRINQKDF